MANLCSAQNFVTPKNQLIDEMMDKLETNPDWDAIQIENDRMVQWHVGEYTGKNLEDLIAQLTDLADPGVLVWYADDKWNRTGTPRRQSKMNAIVKTRADSIAKQYRLHNLYVDQVVLAMDVFQFESAVWHIVSEIELTLISNFQITQVEFDVRDH